MTVRRCRGERAWIETAVKNPPPVESFPVHTRACGILVVLDRFDGNLKKRDLETDTPHNTYTRDGLPPTPIALPGQASLDAVTHPPKTPYLYFVARGDGSSEFSTNLADHNRAVAKYQRGPR